MTKRLNNVNTYKITTSRANYAVVLERIKNDTYGNPRFEARVIVLEVFGDYVNPDYCYTSHYRFSGHFRDEIEEAKMIVEEYEKGLRR